MSGGIVVGVDGSEAGLTAADWAAREGALRDLPVRLVHVMPAWAYSMPEDAPRGEVGVYMRDCGRSVLKDAAAHLERQGLDGPGVTTELVGGDPRPTLLDQAEGADVLVVGSHGAGGFGSLLLGSTALSLAGHAACPVVVVRETQPRVHNEIVVGVDGSPHSLNALRLAYEEASIRGARLRAVHAWTRFVAGAPPDIMPLMYTEPDAEGEEQRILSESRAGFAEEYPEVELVEHVVQAHPVDALVEASAAADLVIMGSRGRGGFERMLLGSVTHGVLHHARCPVVVVRGPGD
ncbi:universal stress protein [Bailinhaonella thermotolerans]|uniref:universal stress protein n=1 Tax=Bailinhaonella thermotolerans TaxID=1070861 RepID=UPI001F5B4A26|nr:universal stress protein [Bailinhaonella thermotolerans]